MVAAAMMKVGSAAMGKHDHFPKGLGRIGMESGFVDLEALDTAASRAQRRWIERRVARNATKAARKAGHGKQRR